MERVGVGTVGFVINLSVVYDSNGNAVRIDSNRGSLMINVKRPDGSEVTWVPIITSGLNGTARYTTVKGDLDMVGIYKIQVQWDSIYGETLFGGTSCLCVDGEYR